MNHDRYLRRLEKRKAKAERPLKDLMHVLENHVVPTVYMMKGFYENGDFQAVGQGIKILLDCFSEFEYTNSSEQPNQSGESHGPSAAVEPATVERSSTVALDAGSDLPICPADGEFLERARAYPLPLTVSEPDDRKV